MESEKSFGKHPFLGSLLILCMLLMHMPARAQEDLAKPTISFTNIQSDKVKRCFEKVIQRYTVLHHYDISVKQRGIKSATMQAQPVFSVAGIFRGVKKYQIKLDKYVRDSGNIPVEDLPEEVLIGWFAHELGHVVDYQPYSNLQMLSYGIRYLISPKFKRQAEYAADYIAIAYGFKQEILASKHFILDNASVDEVYKQKIRTYYLSIEETEACKEEVLLMGL